MDLSQKVFACMDFFLFFGFSSGQSLRACNIVSSSKRIYRDKQRVSTSEMS